MKKIFPFLAVTFLLAGCGKSPDQMSPTESSANANAPAASSPGTENSAGMKTNGAAATNTHAMETGTNMPSTNSSP